MQFENSLIQGVQRSWRDAFSIDLRSLALFRMGLAATLLYNLATRSRDLVAMYTDSGYLPVATWRATVDVSFWSLHGLRGETTFVVLLFLLHAVAGVALLVGYRARLASCLAWLLLVSLHHRNPLLLSGGDVLLGMLLFWSIMLPTDARWSVAAWRGKYTDLPQRYFSAASCGAMLQVFLMYLVTGLSKCNEAWWSGDALFRVFHFELIARPLGQSMLGMPRLLWWLTISALFLELSSPWLLLISKFRYRIRLFAVVSLIALHLGIELTMQVLIFSWVSLSGLMLFLPTTFWDWCDVERWLGSSLSRNSTAAAPGRHDRWARPLILLVSIFAISYAFTYNLLFLAKFNDLPVPISAGLDRGVERVGEVFGWTQKWNMFSKPKRHDFRFATVATLPNGQLVDLLHDGMPVSLDDPTTVDPRAASQRWMLTLLHLGTAQHAKFLPAVTNYWMRQWNQSHPESEQIDLVDHIVLVRPLDPQGNPMDLEIRRLIQVDRHASGGYVDGQPDGPWEFRYPNGQRSAAGEFRQGKKVGTWTTWYPDGTLESRGAYENDQFEGPWEFYDEQGRCVREVYRAGKNTSHPTSPDAPTSPPE